ncbi:phage tail tip lysozyme [Bradyrhizobium sp. SRS-191]|uniref:phage tail tip lysozyme n=1 Tax=Bradyrhizobium sp. SRS-191 TaxID=2962606 RepID=UPI00211EDE41|nr:phage tail tip lysozyme [Bradyrhizobium sp. SRS-191]
MAGFDESEFDPQTYSGWGPALLKTLQGMVQPQPPAPDQSAGPGLGLSVRSEINPSMALIDRLRGLQQEQAAYQPSQLAAGYNGAPGNPVVPKRSDQTQGPSLGTATKLGNARRAFEYYVKQGLPPHQAAGIVGNLMGESGHDLNPAHINPGDGQDKTDSIGIAQWNSTRAEALRKYAASKGVPWTDFETQLEFLHSELQGPEKRAYRALLGASTPAEAGQAMLLFERPKNWKVPGAHLERGQYAEEFYQKMNKLGSIAPGEAPPPSSSPTLSKPRITRQLISRPSAR